MMKTDECDQTLDALPGSRPEVELANGVLIQAKRDLRRFRAAQDSVGRHMYEDAYSWVAANDFSWPYSFMNVCQVLGLTPDLLREELLAPRPASWYARSRQAAKKFSASFRGSVDRFLSSRNAINSRRPVQPVAAI